MIIVVITMNVGDENSGDHNEGVDDNSGDHNEGVDDNSDDHNEDVDDDGSCGNAHAYY